jgi:hypothetical protein
MTSKPTMNERRFRKILGGYGMTVRGASHFLGVAERTMARWVGRDHIPGF